MIALKCNHRGLADQLILLVGNLYFELILKLTISIIVFFRNNIATCEHHILEMQPLEAGRPT